MNNKVWVALILLVVVAGVFLLLRGGPQEELPESYTVEAVPILHRIEIVGAEGEDGPDLIVLQRRENQWWITRPVEARMDRQKAEQFATVFGRDIRTDDLEIHFSQAKSYDLDEGQAVRVSLYTAGVESAAQELLVGREMLVAQTGARRTFIQPAGEDRIYRAHGAFGELVRTPVRELRERSVISVGTEGVESVEFTHDDGHQVGVKLRGKTWESTDGLESLQVDQRRAARLAATVGRLDAVGFFDGQPEELALDTPKVVVKVVTGLDTIHLDLVTMQDGEDTRYFVRPVGRSLIYEIGREDGQLLTMRLPELRDRSVIGVGSSALSEIELAGEDRVRLRRGHEGWEMVHPTGVTLDREKADRLAQFIAGLRAETWVENIPFFYPDSETEVEVVRIGIDGHETTLTLGRSVGGMRGARYARYSEEPGLFILADAAVKRLTARAQSLSVDQ